MTVHKYGQFIFVFADGLTGPTASTWEQIVFQNLRQLDRSRTGACILQNIQLQAEPVTIKPYLSTAQKVQAYQDPVFPAQAYYPNRPVRDGDGALMGGTGSGLGSSSVIEFTPWRFKWANSAATILLHELFHALQSSAGVRYANPIGWGFDTQFEFDAILIENYYRSETGLNLRKNHQNFDKLEGLMVPQVEQYRKLLVSFRTRMPALAARLAALATTFNPYRVGAQGYVAL